MKTWINPIKTLNFKVAQGFVLFDDPTQQPIIASTREQQLWEALEDARRRSDRFARALKTAARRFTDEGFGCPWPEAAEEIENILEDERKKGR